MIEGEFTVLDHLDHIQVPGKVFEQSVNEYWALLYLWEGLEFLYRQVKACDERVKQKVNPDGQNEILITGNHPHLQGIPNSLLTCAFHWYAISACQYVRTVGTIAYRQDNKRQQALDYLKKVIPEVRVYRDKVAAHFSWNSKHPEDNDAERLLSAMPQLGFRNDSFFVGSLTVALSKGGKKSNSGKIKPWSLCKVHEQLRERYSPNP